MKLGVVVVYLVKEENEPLLDLHLDRIQRHTSVPYAIYGCATRLSARCREKLTNHPRVELCDFPATELRVVEEHSYYLEQLVKAAVDDGATHVVTMHVDSFPIRSDWVEEMTGKMRPGSPLVAICRAENRDHKPHPSCMMFTREFYLRHHPTFLLTDAERSSSEYKSYLKQTPHIVDSGVGYGFVLYREGLEWHRLMRSNRGEDHYLLGSVYADLVFHLGAAARDDKLFFADALRLQKLGGVLRWVGYEKRLEAANRAAYGCVREQLLRDPDAYLNYLRAGGVLRSA